jgi:DNA-binding winged helix-turn-helix (wHTH) protein/tetratricopeptide (TPR) repeat protein
MDRSQARLYEFAEFALDAQGARLLRRGEPVHLPPKAFDLLRLLVSNPGTLLGKDQILSTVWPDTFVEEANLANNVSLLRKALGAKGPEYIETVPKRGYRFTAQVDVRETGTSPGADAARLIVLPFRGMEPAADPPFLTHGLPEAVSHALSALNSLVVRSSLAAEKYRSAHVDLRQVAAETNVDYVLAGTIAHLGDSILVSVELVETARETIVWSAECRVAPDEIFGLKDRLVAGVVDALSLPLSEREREVLRHDVPANALMYEYYLRANAATRNRNLENMYVARDLYAACVEADPGFAPAWVGLGRCHRFLQKFGDPAPQHLDCAQRAFHRAFELNPHLGIAHNLFTQLEADMGRATHAMVRLLERALHRHTDPELFAGLVHACRYAGELDASVAAHHRARRLDPNVVTRVAHTWFLNCEFSRAIEQYERGSGFYMDAAALAALGHEREALERLRRRHKTNVSSGTVQALMDSLEALLEGDRPAAIRLVRESIPWARTLRDLESSFYLARHFAWLGEVTDSLSMLNEILEQGFLFGAALDADPWLAPIRSCSGFDAIRARCRELRAAAHAAFLRAGGGTVLRAAGLADTRVA